MKKVLLFAAVFISLNTANSQTQSSKSNESITQHSVLGKDGVIRNPEVIPVVFHGETQPWRDIAAHATNVQVYHEDDWGERFEWEEEEEEEEGKLQGRFLNNKVNPNALPIGEDPIRQKFYNHLTAKSTQAGNWEGMTTTTFPGDPVMDVGPNHVVQMLNSSSGSFVKIWDKSGNVVMNQTSFNTLVGQTTDGGGDPIVLYDQRADRWVVTQFTNPNNANANRLYIAISTTPDPTGTYYFYTVNTTNFPDYPKYAIWDDSYVVTTNENSDGVYVMDRNSMLAGGTTSAQRFTMPHYNTITFQVATPVSMMGTTASGDNCMIMRVRDDGWSGVTSDALEMWEVNIDWTNPTASTMSQTQTISVSPYDSDLCGYTGFSCIPQPSGKNPLDPLREILMNRIMYRNFGSHESIVCAHVTDVTGSDLAGIRWYELRRTGGPTSNWSVYQEGTYSPDSDNRWMPTIGISESGNIGLAFNVSSSSVFPSIRYTGRKECDPLGQMTEPEVTLIAGSASQGGNTSNSAYVRWGDYNAMGVDPTDGETFWFTAQYTPTTTASTRIGAFKINTCGANVQFANSTYTVNEPDANVSNGCLDYYILQVPISISADPSQPADVTVNVSGGTATQGVDYDISNTTFTFDGTTLSGNVVIWVYNDNYVEGPETITLDYTLNANGGDAAAGTLNQSVTITINDDDLAPNAMVNNSTILTQDFESGMAPFTTVNPSGDTPWQIGNVTNTPNGAYAIPSDNATEFAWIDDDDCNCDQSSVYLESPVIDLSTFTSVQMTFDSYYEGNTWSGNSESAEVRISTDGGTTYTTVQSVNTSQIDVSWVSNTVDLTPYIGNANVKVGFWYSDGTGWLYGCAVDNIIITGNSPIDIQQAVNTTAGMTAEFGPNSTVHFYDPATNDVMVSLTNTSSWDYGCVTVEVDRDGTTPTALQFNTTNTPDYLHGKTYKVTPTNNNPSGTYDITLYYKEAEVTAWETITGNSRTNAEIIKVAGNNRINDVTPANYTSYTIDNIGATVGAFNSDVTFTASFTNGFSGFGVGIYNTPTTVVTHTTVNTNPSCNGGNDGVIVVTASGGASPYQYSIDGGTTWQVSNTFNGLSAGTYNVMVKDAGSVTSVATVETLTNPTAVTYTNTSSDPSCNGGNDGTITLSGNGGTGTLQYSIDGGSTFQPSGSFTGLSAGTYNIVVEDANNCQTTGSITLANPSAVTYSIIVQGDPTCNGTNDGVLVISGNGGNGTYQYSIDNGTTFQASGSFSSLVAGTYNIVVEDGNNCQTSGTVTLNNPSVVSYTASSTNENCNAADGTLTLTGNGGTGTLQYSIDGGTTFQASGSFTGLTAGTYSVVVQDANNCQATGSETVNSNGGVSITSVTPTDLTCNGDGSGQIVIVSSGGTGTITYSIDGGSTTQTSGTFTGLSAGTYSIVVTDANGCQATSSTTVNQPTVLSSSVVSTDVTCNGGNDGSGTITANGGTAPYTYSYDGGTTFIGTNTYNALPAGNYPYIVQDANGCQTSGNVAINEPSAVTFTSTSSDPTCNGSTDGAIVISGNGGTGSLQYSIDGGTTFQASGSFTGLASGTYSIVVEDANNCQSTGSITLNNPPLITFTTSTVGENCNSNDGSITIAAGGGTGSLQYSIDGGTTFQASNAFNSLSTGIYNIVVQDANGCQATGTANVNSIGGVTITSVTPTDLTCNGDGSGQIVINSTGGTGTITYSIDGGSTSQTNGTFTNLTAGTYSIVVTDANGCSATSNTTINEPGAITIGTTITDENCGSANGAITITSSGGTGALQYSIDGGSTFQSNGTFTGLASGSYSIVVQDANNCQNSSTVNVNNIGGPTLNNVASNDLTCNGSADGSITITASGGTSPLQYSIDGGSTFQGSGSFTGLAAGTFNIIVVDAGGCQTSSSVTLSEPTAVSFTSTVTDASCGANDGSIVISATGGNNSYQYSIDGGSTYQANGTFSNLTSGVYNIEVIDGNGCTSTGTASINATGGATISNINATDPSCYGQTNGSIVINVSGGTAPIQYSIDGGNTYQSTNTFNGLGGGTYSIVVNDANGCQAISSVSLTDPSQLFTSINESDATCGNNDGSATVSVVGGAGSYTYQWDDSNMQTSATASNLGAGLYHVTVIDANGCSINDSTYISNIGDPTIITSSSDVSCNGNSDGSAVAQIIGGVSPYTITWSDSQNQTTDTAINLSAGTYTVQVIDNAGCIDYGVVTINEPNALAIAISGINTSCAMNNGLATATVSGGTAPYIYSWNDANNQATATAINLMAGSYMVQVMDANGCMANDTITLMDSDSLVVTVDVVHESCEGQSDGSITTTVASGQSPFSYLWSTGDTTSSIANLTAGEYTVSVSDAHNCSSTLLIPIETIGGNCIVIPTAISPNGDGANDVWFIEGLDEYPDAKVEIYNRWGGMLFSSENYQNDWNGTYKGQNVPAGVYYYIVKLNEDETYTGSLTIIR